MANSLRGIWDIYLSKHVNYYSKDTEKCRIEYTRILAYLCQTALDSYKRIFIVLPLVFCS